MKDIEAKDQFSLLNEVIHEQNTNGFIVTRIVTENFPTNSNTFKFFNQGNRLLKKISIIWVIIAQTSSYCSIQASF